MIQNLTAGDDPRIRDDETCEHCGNTGMREALTVHGQPPRGIGEAFPCTACTLGKRKNDFTTKRAPNGGYVPVPVAVADRVWSRFRRADVVLVGDKQLGAVQVAS